MKSTRTADSPIVLVRAEYFLLYVDWLRKLGAPVDRELRKARLPTLIEELPEEYISLDLAYRFLGNSTRAEGIDDIGFEAGWPMTADALGPAINGILHAAPTLKLRLEILTHMLSFENSGLRCELRHAGDATLFIARQYFPEGGDSRISEWPTLKAAIEIVRSRMGTLWNPPVIGLKSTAKVSPDVREALGNTRILTGQPVSFVEIPKRVLTKPFDKYDSLSRHLKNGEVTAKSPVHAGLTGNDRIDRLATALLPYFVSGYPSVDLAAEIAGTSTRSLQRDLARLHVSYSDLIERIRHTQAVHLLRIPASKIVDIAMTLGYADASNFTRAFRRISGTTPSELRQQLTVDEFD